MENKWKINGYKWKINGNKCKIHKNAWKINMKKKYFHLFSIYIHLFSFIFIYFQFISIISIYFPFISIYCRSMGGEFFCSLFLKCFTNKKKGSRTTTKPHIPALKDAFFFFYLWLPVIYKTDILDLK